MTPFEKYNFFKLSIIDDNVESVLANFRHYLSDKRDSFTSKSQPMLDFGLICDQPELDYNGDFKFLIFEPITNPGRTVFFSNLSDGWYTAIHIYAKVFKKDVLQIGLTINKKTKKYPSYYFVKLFYRNSIFEERVVQLIKEDKWVFYENSQKVKPLEIEEIERYNSKRKSDRLSNDIILDYLYKAGYNLRDERFFSTGKQVYYCRWD